MNDEDDISDVNSISLLSQYDSVDKKTPNQRIKEIDDEISKYKFLMNLLIFNSGFLLLLELPNLYYIKQTLSQNASNYTRWHTFRSTPWVIKPIFGCFSDIIFPFRLK